MTTLGMLKRTPKRSGELDINEKSDEEVGAGRSKAAGCGWI